MVDDKKILLVDDDDFLLDMYSVKFNEHHMLLDIAHNGEEAIEILKKQSYKAILLDVVMPSVDGFDVLRKIRDDDLAPNTLTLILTNLGQKEDIDKGISLGADDYIIKAHYTPSEVVEKVKNLLKKHNRE